MRQPWVPPSASGATLGLIDSVLPGDGRVRTGEPEVIRRWSISTVLRVPTNRGPVWFKAVPPAFAHEGRIARWVSTVRPEHGVRVIGLGDGWLLTEQLPGRDMDPPVYGHALDAAARIQLASVGRTDELIALGCPEQGPTHLLALLEALGTRTDVLEVEEARALSAALPRVARALEPVCDDGVPSVLVHGDLQEENVLWAGGSWVLIDWTDATVSHPFTELARPLMHAGYEERARARTAFCAVWSALLSSTALQEALRAAPVLGASHQVANYLRIVDGIGGADGLRELLSEWVRRLLAAVGQNHDAPIEEPA